MKNFLKKFSIWLLTMIFVITSVNINPKKAIASTNDNLTINITCDDIYELYVNGKNIGKGDNWREAKKYDLNLNPGKNVIAVKAIDTGIRAGLLAEITNEDTYIITDRNWRTSTDAPTNWNSIEFDDTTWKNAMDCGKYGVSPWLNYVNDFPKDSDAHWIWHEISATTVYFRLTISVYDDAENGRTVDVENPIESIGAFTGVESKKKDTVKEFPNYLNSRTDEDMPETGSITIPKSEIDVEPKVGDIYLTTEKDKKLAIKVTSISKDKNEDVVLGYEIPDTGEVFDECEIPLQDVLLTDSNFVSSEEVSKSLSYDDRNVKTKSVKPRTEGSTHIIDFEKVLINENNSYVKATGTLKLIKPKVRGKYRRKGFDLSFITGEEAKVNLTGNVKLKKEVKIPIIGYKIDASVGRANLGVFLVVGVDGKISFEYTIDQKYTLNAGIKGRCFFYIPRSARPYAEKTSYLNASYTIKGEIKAWAGVQPEISLKIVGKNIVNLNVFLGIDSSCKFESGTDTLTTYSLVIDAVFRGKASVLRLKTFTLFNLRWNIVNKSIEGEPKPTDPKPSDPSSNGYWTFKNGSAEDSSNKGNNGTLIGKYTIVNGKKNQALKLDGSGYMEVKNSPTLNFGTGDFSIAFWINTDSTENNNTVLDKRESKGYHITLYNGVPLIQISDSTGEFNYWEGYNGKKVNDGKWHHIAFTVDRDNVSGLKLYIDGNLSYTTCPTNRQGDISNNSPLYIGKHKDGRNNFCGILDELIIYNRNLNESEVKNMCSEKKSINNGYWTFENGGGEDYSGKNNNGVLKGNYTIVNGKKGKGLELNNSGYMQVNNSPTLNFGTEDFSISFWVNTSNEQTDNTILDKRDSKGYHVILYAGVPLIQLSDGTGEFNYWEGYNGKKVNDGKWHHIAFTVDRDNVSGLKLYIDGKLSYTTYPTNRQGDISNNSHLYIGKHKDGNGDFKGILDEISIYNGELTEEEVKNLYLDGEPSEKMIIENENVRAFDFSSYEV